MPGARVGARAGTVTGISGVSNTYQGADVGEGVTASTSGNQRVIEADGVVFAAPAAT
jgi:hypothetical protein